jgi:hypothetical protein
MANLLDIPQTSRDGRYACDIPWDYLETWIEDQAKKAYGIDLDPDFQRGHVWTDAQRSAFMEFALQGGKSSQVLHWNAPNWMGTKQRPGQDLESTIVLVDGKQRLETIRRFIRNDLPVFGKPLRDWDDHVIALRRMSVRMSVNDLTTRKDLLQWYIGLNGGGTPHGRMEIARVSALLKAA